MFARNITTIFLLFFFLLPAVSCALEHAEGESGGHAKLSIEEALPILDTIDDLSVRIGSGKSDIYVFIDPLCPHSRNFIGMISENRELMKKYTYHLWLYRLPKFDSLGHIFSVYNREKQEAFALIRKIMIDKTDIVPDREVSDRAADAYRRISEAAEKLDIYKRPYLFIDKKE